MTASTDSLMESTAAGANAVFNSLMKPINTDKAQGTEAGMAWLPERVKLQYKALLHNGKTAGHRMRTSVFILAHRVSSEEGSLLRRRLRQLRVFINSRLYALVSCFVILLHAVFIGLEQTKNLQGDSYGEVKYTFTGFYILELLLRSLVYGPSGLRKDGWVKFDAVILVLEIIGDFLLHNYNVSGDTMLLLRLVKLLPLLRTLRPIVRFRVLKVIVLALMSSTGIMFNTVLLILLFCYVFGVLGAEVIGNHTLVVGPEARGDFHDIAAKYFPSIPGTMVTLVQFICLDAIAAIYRPLVRHEPFLVIYFLSVILVLPIMTLNLVTGVIVSMTQEHIRQDKDDAQRASKSKLARSLRDVFVRLDEDETGLLTKEEVEAMNEKDRLVLGKCCNIGDPLTIFEALDPEETGSISLEDFCNAVWQLATSKVSLEAQQMEKRALNTHRRVMNFEVSQVRMQGSLERVLALQRSLQETLSLESSSWCKVVQSDAHPGCLGRTEVPWSCRRSEGMAAASPDERRSCGTESLWSRRRSQGTDVPSPDEHPSCGTEALWSRRRSQGTDVSSLDERRSCGTETWSRRQSSDTEASSFLEGMEEPG